MDTTVESLRTGVAIAAQMVLAGPVLAELWPGFWPEGRPFLIVLGSPGALLVAGGAPPSPYEPLPAGELPPELHGRAHYHRGYPTGLGENSFSLRFAVGQDTVPALPLMGRTRFDSLEFYFHEAFHGFQRSGGAFVPLPSEPSAKFGERLVDSTHLTAPTFVPLGEVERRMLAHALDVPPGDSLRALLRAYLAVRDRRTNAYTDVQAAERRMERWEGTAQLVGCQAAAAVLGEPAGRVVGCVRAELRTPLASWSNFPEADAQLMRWRHYGTGAALALLLDQLDVTWRPALASGTPLDQLVAHAVGFDAAHADALADEALARFGAAAPRARP